MNVEAHQAGGRPGRLLGMHVHPDPHVLPGGPALGLQACASGLPPPRTPSARAPLARTMSGPGGPPRVP